MATPDERRTTISTLRGIERNGRWQLALSACMAVCLLTLACATVYVGVEYIRLQMAIAEAGDKMRADFAKEFKHE